MLAKACMILLVALSVHHSPGHSRVRIQQQGGEENAIRQRLDEWLKAFERADLTALNEIMAPDYVITVSNGRMLSREEDLAPIREGMRFKSARADSVVIRVIGSAAVVTGHGTYEVIQGGRTLTVQERFTDVWAKREGRWHPIAGSSVGLRAPKADSTGPGRSGTPRQSPS
jgi:ketosteroid isomerase-like protein